MAKEFSMQCAEILKNIGFKVLYSDKVLPTPVLAYNAKRLDACAVMFTASHNPPEYLGIKFIPDYAGPATSEITDEIVSNFGKDVPSCVKGKLINTDFSNAYFKHIKGIIDFEKIKDNLDKSHIIFDGLYAASIGYFDKLLNEKNIKFDSIRMYHDPNFGGGMPEPKPQFMGEMIDYIKAHKNYVGFANDGDSDRFGVVNENGEYVTPNEIIAILLKHLKKNKKMSGCLVKTVGASLMLDIVAEKLGVEVVETPVGFKHVGEAMRKYDPIIAGEESGGLSIQGHIPEKDGILANLLILEAMAYEGKSLVQLQKEVAADNATLDNHKARKYGNYQLLETGYRDFNEDLKKRFREIQFCVNISNAEQLKFHTAFTVDDTDVVPLYKHNVSQCVDKNDVNYFFRQNF